MFPSLDALLRAGTDSAKRTQAIQEHVARLQDRHIAERFARGMELLGDDKLEVRWGGIFALERIARLSPQDQGTVAEILAAYVRRHAPWKAKATEEENEQAQIESEIQLILTILGRRKWSFKNEDRPLDLHGTNLAKAHLPFAGLEYAFLYDCNLEGALLFRANLQGAWMARCRLRTANLDGAQLQGADLSDVSGLTPEQLRHVRYDEKTVFPPAIARALRSMKAKR